MSLQAHLLPDGARLHLQHGPIDLVIGAEGPDDARARAFRAAQARLETVLTELVGELPLLRAALVPGAPLPEGRIARHMDRATRPFSQSFITRMAAVAGAVADTVLQAMKDAAPLDRAFVNNGGDIALWLAPGQRFVSAMQGHDGRDLGRIAVSAGQGIGGIATSGRHGRSLSFGIADSVTVLARDAAQADAAATMIANAVDLADHPAITRMSAQDLDPDSDLGARAVVTDCGPLPPESIARALSAGLARAAELQSGGLIASAALYLQGQAEILGPHLHPSRDRSLAHA